MKGRVIVSALFLVIVGLVYGGNPKAAKKPVDLSGKITVGYGVITTLVKTTTAPVSFAQVGSRDSELFGKVKTVAKTIPNDGVWTSDMLAANKKEVEGLKMRLERILAGKVYFARMDKMAVVYKDDKNIYVSFCIEWRIGDALLYAQVFEKLPVACEKDLSAAMNVEFTISGIEYAIPVNSKNFAHKSNIAISVQVTRLQQALHSETSEIQPIPIDGLRWYDITVSPPVWDDSKAQVLVGEDILNRPEVKGKDTARRISIDAFRRLINPRMDSQVNGSVVTLIQAYPFLIGGDPSIIHSGTKSIFAHVDSKKLKSSYWWLIEAVVIDGSCVPIRGVPLDWPIPPQMQQPPRAASQPVNQPQGGQ